MCVKNGVDTDRDPLKADETEGKYLIFWTERQLFGVPTSFVAQIVGVRSITEILDYPAYAKGIMNPHGTMVPVIDIRLRFGKPEAEYTDRTYMIVSNINGRDLSFIVDGVEGVTDIPGGQVSPPPQMGADLVNGYLTGIATLEDSSVVFLIDASRVLDGGEFAVADHELGRKESSRC